MANLDSPITLLPSVTHALAKKLGRGLGIRTLGDVLKHLPERYQDIRAVTHIAQVSPDGHATIQGTLKDLKTSQTWKRRLIITEALLSDETGSIRCVWFNQPWVAQRLAPGMEIIASGKLTRGSRGPYFAPSFWESLGHESNVSGHTSGLLAVYPETEGVTSRWMRWLVQAALKKIGTLSENLPREIIEAHALVSRDAAVRSIHVPKDLLEAARGRERLEFEELFTIECAVLQAKARAAQRPAPKIPMDIALIQRFIATLPYALTDAQRKTAFQILKDMGSGRPMNRLIAGEVGSGKTVVAAIAMLNAAKAHRPPGHRGFQAALMAPTEILAQQHFKTLAQILAPFKIRVALLTGSTNRATPKRVMAHALPISRPKLWKEVAAGEIEVLVGTHALISTKPRLRQGFDGQAIANSQNLNSFKPSGPIRFKNLGLAIVDEQHRFGVNQRAKLAKLQSTLTLDSDLLVPHFLTMTATPIPRSLALTIFGDLDISTMTELPQERLPVACEVITQKNHARAYDLIRQEVAQGHQAFVICPLVKRSEKLQAKAAEVEYERLSKDIFQDLRLGLLHGQMDAKEKEKVMKTMKAGKIDILVATSVVEVGIDIPNATVIAIENAERFGLAQLYQLRGRVGRAEHQSTCVLLVEKETPTAMKRLAAMQKAGSGPELAKEDLAIRGPGEFAGTRQAGMPDIAMHALANIDLIEKTREAAKQILSQDLALTKFPELSRRVHEVGAALHLS